MHITRYTDYSLRVLIYLAEQGDRLATIQEIADRYEISKNHLMKVVHQLNKKGYIETIRGKKGGMRLHMAPNEIKERLQDHPGVRPEGHVCRSLEGIP
jgi:Rrf2 family nitric oxide-sensitive transcriptional repressor